MTLEAKITTAQTVISDLSKRIPVDGSLPGDIQLPGGVQLPIDTQNSLFEKVKAKKEQISEEQQKIEIDIIAMGILVLVVAMHRKEHEALLKTIKQDANTPTELVVLMLGTNVLNKELPFEFGEFQNNVELLFPKFLKAASSSAFSIFPSSPKAPKLPKIVRSSILDDLENTPAYKIAKTFNDALDAASTCNEGSSKNDFIDAVKKLKNETLANFESKLTGYNPDECLGIANSTLTLATKVGANTVTKDDVKAFETVTKQYEISEHLNTMLLAIISAVMGMIIGAAVGFVVGGGLPGAAVGAASGFWATGGLTYVALSKTEQDINKHDPVVQVSVAAQSMEQPAPRM